MIRQRIERVFEIRLVGVTMDEQGILPDALASACRQHKPKAIYLVPTIHNPTTATLGLSRRKAVAEIIRKAGAILIEDDAYGSLDPSVSPIAILIPERTYLAVSLSKCIAPALRVSPDVGAKQMLRSNLQATSQMAPVNANPRYALASFRRRLSDRYSDP